MKRDIGTEGDKLKLYWVKDLEKKPNIIIAMMMNALYRGGMT
jgi:hypothetical protein